MVQIRRTSYGNNSTHHWSDTCWRTHVYPTHIFHRINMGNVDKQKTHPLKPLSPQLVALCERCGFLITKVRPFGPHLCMNRKSP